MTYDIGPVGAGVVTSRRRIGSVGATGPVYATLNPADKSSAMTLSGGNLIATNSAAQGAYSGVRSNKTLTGKRYFEWKLPGATAADLAAIGIVDASYQMEPSGTTAPTGNKVLVWNNDGIYGTGGISIVSGLGWVDANSIMAGAVDQPNMLAWFVGPSGQWNGNGTANPVTGVGGIAIPAGITSIYFGGSVLYPGAGVAVNFGASAFGRTVPTGFSGVS